MELEWGVYVGFFDFFKRKKEVVKEDNVDLLEDLFNDDKDYIKQFEFPVDSKIRPAETKALETNPIDGNVYTGARAVLGEQETETPEQKLERLNREAEEYLKKDKSSNTLDLLINDTVKQTEELIKDTQK